MKAKNRIISKKLIPQFIMGASGVKLFNPYWHTIYAYDKSKEPVSLTANGRAKDDTVHLYRI